MHGENTTCDCVKYYLIIKTKLAQARTNVSCLKSATWTVRFGALGLKRSLANFLQWDTLCKLKYLLNVFHYRHTAAYKVTPEKNRKKIKPTPSEIRILYLSISILMQLK